MLKDPWAVIKNPNSLLCGRGDDKGKHSDNGATYFYLRIQISGVET